jgi:hypothetical protein
VLALVVVIDLGKAVDRLGDGGQLFRRHGHRRQRRGADALGREDGADAGNLAFAAQVFQPAQDGPFANAEARGQFGERRRTEREIALEVVEQAEVERRRPSEADAHGAAGEEDAGRRLPGNSPSLAKVAVS